MKVSNQLYTVSQSFNSITRLHQQFENLTQQLTTGKSANSLSELGSNRLLDINFNNKLSRLEAYQNNITMVNLRLDVMDLTVGRLSEIADEALSSAQVSNYGEDSINMVTTPKIAESQLDEVLSLLNTDVAGRYLFGGNQTENEPVAALKALLNGSDGKAGFKTVVTERNAADRGDDGLGRLDIDQTGADVTLAEDGVHPFGFKLSSVATTSADVALTAPSGSPQSLGVSFTDVPNAGDTVTLTLTLPDGTSEALTLTAVEGTPGEGEFQIGTDADATAANFAAGLQTALNDMGERELTAASTYAAAENFFNGQGEDVLRVDGPPYDTATALVAATDADTILWYTGSDEADARATVTARVSDSSKVSYGAQANEDGILTMVRSLAVLSVSTFSEADETAEGRFDATMVRQRENLSTSAGTAEGSLQAMAVELGLARTTAGSAQERQEAYASQLETMLAEIEEAPIEEVAMMLSAIQTRLQASYQTMAVVNQLSLVNYL